MEADRFSESAQFARKLQQAVLSLRPGAPVARRQVPRMAQALALAELMAAKAHGMQIRPRSNATTTLGGPA
ncbi:MAG: hypothetical protein GX652_07900 [Burkholderiaceae bacterium]|nr:hypothetical protein [Burkholderiaceae bacterium]